MGTSRCCVPICNSTSGTYARGLCRRCYLYASKLVTAGKTSWDVLEEEKKIAPAEKPMFRALPFNALRDYFLGPPLLTGIKDRLTIK